MCNALMYRGFGDGFSEFLVFTFLKKLIILLLLLTNKKLAVTLDQIQYL
ncbi:MAG: hypothetical protein IRF16MM_05410 [Candidatus Midichloria mitochondrii]